MTRASSILISLFFVILETAAQSDTTDIFPLTKGLRCVYQYHENYYWWSWGSSGGSTDSAIAECVVIDSTMISDTTRVWTVIQINYRANAVDTVTFSLRESTTGYHHLTSDASPWYEDSRIWAFPIVFQSQVFPVFRFSDSTRMSPIHQSFGCTMLAFPNSYDSLWFSNDSGLVRRVWSRCLDLDQSGWYYWRTAVLLSRTIASVEQENRLPEATVLLQNYPNPFNPTTSIGFRIADYGLVTLKVFDVLGREVATLVDEVKEVGEHSVEFSSDNLPSGVYFYQLKTNGHSLTKKMALIQ